MRIDVKKFLFVGIEKERKRFFAKAQEAGVIHFIKKSEKKAEESSPEANRLWAAIKIVRHLPLMEQQEVEELEIAGNFAENILKIDQSLKKLEERERILRLEIARIEIFGNFSIADIAYIEREGKLKIQLFVAGEGSFKEELPEGFFFVGSHLGLDYFVSVAEKAVWSEKLTEIKIEESVGVLKKNLEEVQRERHLLNVSLKEHQKYNDLLHYAFYEKINQSALAAAEEEAKSAIDQTIFAIEGWVPVNQRELLQEICKQLDVDAIEIAIEREDPIPTCLQNEGWSQVGEDLVHIYEAPSHTDKDPSLWVLFSFAVFFALIIGDGGYGLVFLLTALWLRYKASQFEGVKKMGWECAGKRVWKLFTLLALFCIVWGFLNNSFFGISLAPENPLYRVSLTQWLIEKKAAYHIGAQDNVYQEWVEYNPQLLHVDNPRGFVWEVAEIDERGGISYPIRDQFADQIAMELALFIGVVHISLSLMRYIRRNPASLGWLFFLVGGYIYFPIYLDATSMVDYLLGLSRADAAWEGLYLMYGGIGFSVLISVIKNRLWGILDLMQVVQIFSDVMSYLRLYALSLAGAIIAVTINEMSAGAGVIFGFLIMILGHAVNIVMSVMGGVIHGLRLNFLEWYHYSFEGGGTLFKPLSKFQLK